MFSLATKASFINPSRKLRESKFIFIISVSRRTGKSHFILMWAYFRKKKITFMAG